MDRPADPAPPPAAAADTKRTSASDVASSVASWFSRLRRSDRILGGCAAFLLLSGLLAQGYGAMRGEDPAPRLVAENGGGSRSARSLRPRSSLIDERGMPRPGDSSAETSPEDSESDSLIEWSPAMVRGGFGFFVGFAIGLALRAFLRVSIIVVGLNLLMLFSLSYIGWLEVRWETIEAQFSHWMLSLEEQLTQFNAFVVGSLPTVGLSGAGLFTGFRKR